MRIWLVAAIVLLLAPASADATTFTVTRQDDPAVGVCDADCSLREAVTAANADAADDRILVPVGNHVLSQGQLPTITTTVTVVGAGTGGTSISGGVTAGGATALRAGAFAVTAGRLELLHLTLTGNRVTVDDPATQTITIAGGAVAVDSGSLLLYRTAVTGNTLASRSTVGAGGVGLNSSGATIVESTIAGNVTSLGGTSIAGGLTANGGGSEITVLSSSITANRVTPVGNGTTVAGGINANVVSSFRLENSTVSGNSVGPEATVTTRVGGILSNVNPFTSAHSTIVGNSAEGGGTVSAGSIRANGGSTVTLLGTIVAGGTAPGAGNCSGAFSSQGGNVESTNECGLNPALGDKPSTDPLLGALQANGGPTLTHAIPPDSPAAGAAAAATCPAFDQRGVGRPQGNGCDGGAFEVGPPPPPPPPEPVQPPVNQQRPSLSGTVREGLTVTCAPGGWTGGPSFAFAWLRNGLPISGAAGATYRVGRRDAGRVLECRVTALNAGGVAEAESAPRVALRACIVPTLKGASLATARKRLATAACAVGKVSRRFSSSVARGRVISSSPARRANRKAGTRVALVLSRGRRPR